MPLVHHTAVHVSDVETSLRFWRDGVGLVAQLDHQFEGDWPALFDAPSTTLRSVFLGDPERPDAGIIELVAFPDADTAALPDADERPDTPRHGFLLVSLFTDVDATLARLDELGLGGPPRTISVSGGVRMAVVRDPDGVLVELIDAGASTNLERLGDGAVNR